MAANDELTEIFVDFLNALESACVNAKRQIAEVKGVSEEKKPVAVSELTFNTLKFEQQKGEKLGEFETADKKNNIPEKFQYAFNVLSKSNSVISNRYSGTGYVYTYWTYNNRIFRQKLKAGAQPR